MRTLIALVAVAACALAPATPAAEPIPKPPSTAAESYIVMDVQTGRVLAERNADRRLPPASLTKIMTGYVVYKALASGSIAMDDAVEISERAWRMGGSQMFLEVGTKATVDELLDGLVVQSGNDAALALAEHAAGSEDAFVEQMNHYADRLGLENTHFENPEGLETDEHYASARDLAVLSRAMIREFPERYERYEKRSFTYNEIAQYNRNKLLYSSDHVDGIKTGYTEKAGYCLAASAERDGMRLVSVVMSAPSDSERFEDTRALLAWGFRFFDTHELYANGEVVRTEPIWKGASDEIDLGIPGGLYVTIPHGSYDALEASATFPGRLVAPVGKGEEFGRVTVSLDGETVAEAPLVALSDVPAGGFFARMADTVLQWFQ